MKRLGVKQRLKDPTTQMLQPSWALALDGSLGRCKWNAKEGEVMLFVRIGTSRMMVRLVTSSGGVRRQKMPLGV